MHELTFESPHVIQGVFLPPRKLFFPLNLPPHCNVVILASFLVSNLKARFEFQVQIQVIAF